MDVNEALINFQKWYVEPINKLKELPDGSGGFVAFMVGLVFYERYIIAKLIIDGEERTEDEIKTTMMKDLKLTQHQQAIFWDMFRNGLLHQGMPKQGKTGYWFRYSFSGFPEFITQDGQNYIQINPWKFTDRVLGFFLSNPEYLLASTSYAFPVIYPNNE